MLKMDVNITTVSLKNCVGKEVFDNSGNKFGFVKDFLLKVQEYYVPFVVLSEGGSFNPAIEENYFVIPLKILQIENPEATQLTLKVAAKKLEGVPKISKAQFLKRDANFLKAIEDFYGAEENFTQTHRGAENETDDHQDYEGSAESSENESLDYNSLGEEANYDHIKGIDKKEDR